MIKGIGTDIIEISRIKNVIEKRPEGFCDRFFTEEEKQYCQLMKDPYPHYAVRFAAKEAVVKALGTGFRGMKFTDVEVTRDKAGKPSVQLHGKALEIARGKEIIKIELSLSHSKDSAVAFAIAIAE